MPVRKRILPSGDHCWAYCFDAPGSTKTDRRQIYKSGFVSKKEAADAEALRRIAVHKESELVQTDPGAEGEGEGRNTLSALFEQFFREHGAKSLAPKTLQRYREMAGYLDPELRAMNVTAIRPLRLAREWNRLLTSGGRGRKAGKPLSKKTVRNIAGLVSSVFMRAFRWGIVESNPVPASEPPVPKKHEAVALTTEQQDKLIEAATQMKPWLSMFLELDAAVGARRGELLALRWSDLDGNRLSISKSLCQTGKDVFVKETKNRKNRVITVPASAVNNLRRYREEQKDRCRTDVRGDYIFCNPDGTPLRPDSVSAAVSLLCRSLKLPKGASLHTLRHSHGSQLIAAGIPITDVSKRLGHADVHVTATIYAHALEGRDESVAEAWDKFQMDAPGNSGRVFGSKKVIGAPRKPLENSQEDIAAL